MEHDPNRPILTGEMERLNERFAPPPLDGSAGPAPGVAFLGLLLGNETPKERKERKKERKKKEKEKREDSRD